MDETRARFLASIAKQLPVERVAEVHLFPTIKQGGMESGVAVLALDLASMTPEDEPEPSPTPRRYTVYTARYRHTLKGLDRGKWEVSVTEEADAPLLTVDAVVRGVQRRSGELDDIVRMSGDEMRATIPAAAEQTT
jgi:hypothetical protein